MSCLSALDKLMNNMAWSSALENIRRPRQARFKDSALLRDESESRGGQLNSEETNSAENQSRLGRIGRDSAESTPILGRVGSKRIFTRDERV